MSLMNFSMRKMFLVLQYGLILILFTKCENKPLLKAADKKLQTDTSTIYYRLPNLKSLDSLEEVKSYLQINIHLDSLLQITNNLKDKQYLKLRSIYTKLILENKILIVEAEFEIDTSIFELRLWKSYFLCKSYLHLNNFNKAQKQIFELERTNFLCSYTYNHDHSILLKIIGEFYIKLENYEKADTVLNVILNNEINNLNPDSNFLAIVNLKLGSVKRQNSEYESAQYYLNNCISFSKHNKDQSTFISSLIEIGLIVGTQRNYTKAITFLDSAQNLALIKLDTSRIARCLFVKAIYKSVIHEYPESYKLFNILLALPSKYYSHREVYLRLTQTAIAEKNKAKCIHYFTKAQKHKTNSGPANTSFLKSIEAKYFEVLGNLDLSLRAIQDAIQISEPSIKMGKNILDPPTALLYKIKDMSLHYLGIKSKILFNAYQETKTIIYLNKSIQNYLYIDSLFIQSCRFYDDSDELHAIDIMSQVYFEGIEACLEAYNVLQDTSFLELINQFSERVRGKRFYRDFLTKNIINSSNILELKQMLIEENIVSNKIHSSLEDKKLENLNDLLVQLNEIQLKLEYSFPNEYNNLFNSSLPKINSIRNWCKQQQFNIVQFIKNQSGDLIVITLSKEGLNAKYFKYIDNNVRILDSLLLIDRSNKILNKYLIKSITGTKVIDNKTNYIIIPDAYYSNRPLHSIFSNEQPGNPLHSLNIILYAFTLKTLISTSVSNIISKVPKSALSVSLADKGDFELPYSYLESKYIENNFVGEFISLRGKRAMMSLFQSELKSKDLVHIALHGQGSSFSTNFSGLFFRDGFISSTSLENLDFKPVHSIILNSCQSSLGSLYLGEGIESLIKSFAKKGSSLIVGFNNKINDRESYQLMKHLFYKNKINPLVTHPNLFIYIN